MSDVKSSRKKEKSSKHRSRSPKKTKSENPVPKKRKTVREAEEDNSSGLSAATDVGDSLTLDRFRLSDSVKTLLAEKGIKTLFPIQAQTFDLVLGGCDVVGRAKTGSGKTLAFVLPIVERLMKSDRGRNSGRGPSVLCLTPTRELAKQVCAECDYIGKAANLTSCCIYGSSPYYDQERAMRRGIDFLVGTPGRIKDHINRGNLKLTNLKYQILDECDQMLQMGFVDDVEFILNAVGSREHIQTLLFSATLPSWVKSILQKFCKPDYRTIDLMTSQRSQATNCVVHKCVMTERFMEASILPDLIQCHGNGGRTIVFVDTKANCDKVAEALAASLKARAIHGDLQQKTRETTLEAFRRGEIDVLVATDVAARGLDIPEVGLVIQTSPPKDVESYVHRSGRTGRAENTGVCISVVTRSTEYLLRRIQQFGGIRFQWIQRPQVADMIRMASKKAEQTLRSVKMHKTELFKQSAEEMLKSWEDSTSLVAAALACVTGHSKLQQKSLILRLDQHVTLQLTSRKDGHLSTETALHKLQKKVERAQPKALRLTEDGYGAVFEVHEDHVPDYLASFPKKSDTSIEILTSLPKLKAIEGPHYTHGTYNGTHNGPRHGHHNGYRGSQRNDDRFHNNHRGWRSDNHGRRGNYGNDRRGRGGFR